MSSLIVSVALPIVFIHAMAYIIAKNNIKAIKASSLYLGLVGLYYASKGVKYEGLVLILGGYTFCY